MLTKHDALNRFGITLLHTHFPILDNEVMLEENDIINRIQVLSPVHAPPEDSVETAWRLGKNGESLTNCICVKDPNGDHWHRSHGR